MLCHKARLLRRAAADIRFYGMRQRIHARRCGNALRQSQRHMIIQNGILRNQGKIIDGIFVLRAAVRNDRRQCGFAACSCRCRHRNQ